MLGMEGSCIFDSNPTAEKIDMTSYSYTDFSQVVKKQFELAMNEAVACCLQHLSIWYQVPKETMEEYLAALRAMAADCNFHEPTYDQHSLEFQHRI